MLLVHCNRFHVRALRGCEFVDRDSGWLHEYTAVHV